MERPQILFHVRTFVFYPSVDQSPPLCEEVLSGSVAFCCSQLFHVSSFQALRFVCVSVSLSKEMREDIGM